MQEINKSGFKVDAETVARELQNFLRKNGNSSQGFKASLEEAGYDYGYFEKKFEPKVLIKKYLDEKVFADASNESEKQNMFTSWFNHSKVLAEVVHYDKDLEGLLQRQSASSSCCSVK